MSVAKTSTANTSTANTSVANMSAEKMNPTQIYEIAQEIHSTRAQHDEEFFKKKYPQFTTEYSALFNLCLCDTMDMSILKKAIDILQCRQNGSMDENGSDVEFGKVLSDRFLPR